MSAKVAVVASMRGEVAPLIARLRLRRVASRRRYVSMYASERFVVAYAGMGRERALDCCEALAQHAPIITIISCGWVGALNASATAGCAYKPAAVIDAGSGERFEVAGVDREGVLVTVPHVVGDEEKRDLSVRWKATLVDMEAAHVARFARERGIRFDCIRAVSDAHDERMPDMNRFATHNGQFRTGTFVAYVAVRPWWWASVVRMGRNSSVAARRMCDEIARLAA